MDFSINRCAPFSVATGQPEAGLCSSSAPLLAALDAPRPDASPAYGANACPYSTNYTESATLAPVPERYTGPVVIAEPDVATKLALFAKSTADNRALDLRGAVSGFMDPTPLSETFFSRENMQIVQNGLRAEVYEKSGANQWIVPPQNAQSLAAIMRGIFFQHAIHRPTDIREQVEDLNRRVLDFCVPQVLSGVDSYLKYLRDKSMLPTPMDNPVMASGMKHKELRVRRFL